MAAEVVFNSTTGSSALQGQLFEGIKFWLSAKVPQRSRFINDIKTNGGEVISLEKNADIMIVDHARKEALPGTHSYTYIEKSIRNGALEVLADHAVGPAPGAIRSVGSVTQPPKTTRQKYTQEDERILWDWVNTNPQKSGGTDGNEIYKQLELKNPKHTWQSWRDHWVKQMKGKPRPIYPPNNAPPTPPSELQVTEPRPAQRAVQREAIEDGFDKFSEEDADTLLEHGQDILDLPIDNVRAVWAEWVSRVHVDNEHTAEQWQAFWEQKVRPRFLKGKARREKRAAIEESGSPKPTIPNVQPNSKATSPAMSRDNAQATRKSPSYDPESPELRPTASPAPPLVVRAAMAAESSKRTEDAISPLGNSILKRKRPVEEIPSSSPPQIGFSPLPNRTAKKPREIASTPECSPRRRIERKQESLFLEDVFETEADEILKDSQEVGDSPLGQQPSESLSEPDRSARHSTQANIREATPFIDYGVALPDGGWGGDENGEDADKSESESQYDSAREMPVLPDTQAILESKTQVLDFTVPDPDNPWEKLLPPSSPPKSVPSSPAVPSESSSAQQAQLDAEIEALISDWVAQGFSAEQVVIVLNSTCTDIPLTERVLRQMGPQKGEIKLPQNMKGVWTEEDDSDLYSSDARKVEKSGLKHGPDKVNTRYEWLALMAEED